MRRRIVIVIEQIDDKNKSVSNFCSSMSRRKILFVN